MENSQVVEQSAVNPDSTVFQQYMITFCERLSVRLNEIESQINSKESSARIEQTPKISTKPKESFTEYVGPLKMPSRSSDEEDANLRRVNRRGKKSAIAKRLSNSDNSSSSK